MALRLPRGEVSHDAGDAVRVVLPGDQGERARARVFLSRVASFAERHGEAAILLPPSTIEEQGGALVLGYACPDTVGLAEAAAAWRDDLAAWLPVVLALGRALATAGLALEREGWGFLPLAPPLLRVARAACGLGPPATAEAAPSAIQATARWIALPPLAVSLASFTEADPEAWALASPEALLGDLDAPVGYTAGALLHACIAGDLWPARIPPAERLARLLRGRAGAMAAVRAALASAVPAALAAEGATLAETVALLIDADRSRRLAGDEILARVKRDATLLSASALAPAWQAEGQAQRALDVLDRTARFARPDEAPWEAIGGLAESVGDLSRALDACARVLREDHHALRRYVSLLGKLAAAPDPEALARWIARLDAELAGDLGDAARVYVAHLEARHLGRSDAARARLDARFDSTWCRGLAAVIEARALVESGQHARASRATHDGLALFEGAPGGGGDPGRYACAYLHLLDGIANLGAVDALSDPSFLRDAFACFTRAVDRARAIGAKDLVDAGLALLGRLREDARPGRYAASPPLVVGVDAYLAAHALRALAPAAGAEIPIPWYDEGVLFPPQVVTT